MDFTESIDSTLFLNFSNLFTNSAGTDISLRAFDLLFKEEDAIKALYHIKYDIPKVGALVCMRGRKEQKRIKQTAPLIS